MGCGYELQEENYECCLSPELQKLAQKELREDEATRTHALAQLRDWIEKHPDIAYCRTGIYYRFPQRDDQGRKVILSCVSKFDPYKYSSVDMARIHSIVVESMLDDEENQITGYCHVNDESGMTMAHISLWSLSDIRKVLRCIQNSTPMRHKSTHFVNIPAYANKVFEFFTALLTEKLRDRILVHTSIEEMKKTVNCKILPKEYGGEIPIADMIADYKKYLETKRETILALDDMKIEINRKAKFVTEMEDQQITGMAGSFRKLEVD